MDHLDTTFDRVDLGVFAKDIDVFLANPYDKPSSHPVDELPPADPLYCASIMGLTESYPILYTKNTNGSINQWQVKRAGHGYTIIHGQVGGKLQTSLPQFGQPMNVGKKNETSAEQQAKKEVEALYKKQRKSNYFDSIADVDKAFLGPMLAKPNKDYIDKVKWEDGQLLEDKLNGFACFITAKGAFTRTNEEYHAIPHILEEFKEFFEANPTAYIQGELFNPIYVNELNKIAELIAVTRKPKDISLELLAESAKIVEFHWFDGYGFDNISADTLLRKRREYIRDFIARRNYRMVRNVPFEVCYSLDEAMTSTNAYIAKGGEGKILKNPKATYQHKKTKDLLKLKKMEDAEFKVISIEEGTGNWAGCAKFAWCELPNGLREKKFKANVEGSQNHLREVLKNREKWVGEYITVRYQELSPYATPLIPYTNLVIRSQIEGDITTS